MTNALPSVLDKIRTSRRPKPRKMLLHGVHGVGKTTWASTWPNPILVPTEDGASEIDVPSLPLSTSWVQFAGYVNELVSPQVQHDFKTLIIDSVDWLERLFWDDIIAAKGVASIDDIGYSKGHDETAQQFSRFLRTCDLAINRGMHVILIAHTQVQRFNDPTTGSYDRFTPKLHKYSSALLQEWADEVLFATYEVFTKEEDLGFGKTKKMGVGSGNRILKTQEMPAHVAKSRLNLPTELPLDFNVYQQYLPQCNIQGAVVNGSSKPNMPQGVSDVQ